MSSSMKTPSQNDINVYLLEKWEKTYRKKDRQVLNEFLDFIRSRQIPCQEAFTHKTLKEYQKNTNLPDVKTIIRGFSLYLYSQEKIEEAIPCFKDPSALPQIYEDYLIYHKRTQLTPDKRITQIRRVLGAFYLYLIKANIKLASLSIEHIDTFQSTFHAPLALSTSRAYRYYLCGFLGYLYHERKLIKSDLADLVVTPRYSAQAKPPKFFRPQEIEILFASLELSSAWHLRAYAMIHLAYTMGLRLKEISLISLDDISFSKAELLIRNRKNNNPFTLPIPEQTIKAITTYLIGGRPKSDNRALFLTFFYPYRPVTAVTVVGDIRKCIRKANLPGSAYWFRHTYAQNLLESGASIFEIKEMLGHDCIESAKRYLYIHTKLMREVLFDETL